MTKLLALTSRRPVPEACKKPPWVDVFSDEVAQRICDLVAEGRTLQNICREAWAPKARILYIWFADYPEFRQAYEEARKIAADHLAREIVALADNASTDLEMARLPHQIHAREWLAQRMDPAKYGDKRMVEQTVNASVRSMSVTKIDLSRLSNEELLIAEKALRKAIGHDDPTDDGYDED